MTDTEKTRTIVEKLFAGVCPGRSFDGKQCLGQCHRGVAYGDSECFRPFDRIADAFLCVEKMRERFPILMRSHTGWFVELPNEPRWFTVDSIKADADTLPRAIAEACYLAVTE